MWDAIYTSIDFRNEPRALSYERQRFHLLTASLCCLHQFGAKMMAASAVGSADGGTVDLMLSGAYLPVRQLMEENLSLIHI